VREHPLKITSWMVNLKMTVFPSLGDAFGYGPVGIETQVHWLFNKPGQGPYLGSTTYWFCRCEQLSNPLGPFREPILLGNSP
jgi:hypothetical protein